MSPDIRTVYDETASLCGKLEELLRNHEPSSETERRYDAEFRAAANRVAKLIDRMRLSRSADLSVIVMPGRLCGPKHLEKIVKILRESMEIMQAETRSADARTRPLQGSDAGAKSRGDHTD